MKVEKIIQSNSNIQKIKHRNINMVGFGQNSTSSEEQVSSSNNKKSNEAVKSQFLSNVSFAGFKDNVIVTREDKYGDTKDIYKVYGTSGGIYLKTLDPGESSAIYENDPNYRVSRPCIGKVYHARMERSGTRASGSSAEYVAKDAITQSSHYYNGSYIKENSPIRDNYIYDQERKSVYYSDPGERMDETTPYADYVVYAPGAYYKKRTFWERL